MTFVDIKDLATTLQSLATVVAVAVGGFWTYRRFVHMREDMPHLEYDVDVVFIGSFGGHWLVELVASVQNKGAVRHVVRDLLFEVRSINESDSMPLSVGEPKHHLVHFGHLLVEGSWLHPDWDYAFVDSGVGTTYRRAGLVPMDARFVKIVGEFSYSSGHQHQASRVIKVPDPPARCG